MQMFRDLTGILGDDEPVEADSSGTDSDSEEDRHVKPDNYFDE